MQKKTVFGLILAVALVGAYAVPTVFAQEEPAVTTTPRQDRMNERVNNRIQQGEERQQNKETRQQEWGDRRDERQTRIEEQKEEMQQNREERQDMRQERRGDIAQAHADRLSTRFEMYEERLSMLADKIESRLSDLADAGRDVSASQAKLIEARSALENASALGSKSVAEFSSIDPEMYEEQKNQVMMARDLANEAREAFRSTQVLLREAVALARNSE